MHWLPLIIALSAASASIGCGRDPDVNVLWDLPDLPDNFTDFTDIFFNNTFFMDVFLTNLMNVAHPGECRSFTKCNAW